MASTVTEYRVVVQREGKTRIKLSVESRKQPVDPPATGTAWRSLGVDAAGEDIYEALAKLGKQAKTVGELRAGVLEKIGRS